MGVAAETTFQQSLQQVTNATDVWSVKKANPQSMVHFTEKPVELAVRAIPYASRRDETVLDLFDGSDSTLIAGEQTGRSAFFMELAPPSWKTWSRAA